MYQWEFLIEGLYLLVERFEVTKRLIFRPLIGPSVPSPRASQSQVIAYVAVDGDRPGDALEGRRYLDFFLLLYSFVTGKRAVMWQQIGTPLKKIESLGALKISLPEYQEIESNIKRPDPLWDKGIIDTRELFLKLESDRETLMDGHLGLALRFYYLAVSAAERGSREEFIIHVSIAAEALVQTGEGKLSENLKRRIAALIANESNEARAIAREIDELYRVRGLVVHGHKPKIQLTQTKKMDSYVRRALQNGLELRHLSKKDLAQWLNQNYRKLTGEY